MQAAGDALGAGEGERLVVVVDPETVDRHLAGQDVHVDAVDGDVALREAFEAPYGGAPRELRQPRKGQRARCDDSDDRDEHGEPGDATAGHGRGLEPSIRPRPAAMLDCGR